MLAFFSPSVFAAWRQHTEESKQMAELIEQARTDAKLTRKVFAGFLEISEAQYSRQISGLEMLSLWRLTKAPQAFWDAFDNIRADARGAWLISAARIELLHALVRFGKLTMAKMPAARRSPVKEKNEDQILAARVDSVPK